MHRRARAYLFMLGAAAVGGVLGALVDQVTFTLSADYYVLGKGTGPDRWQVAWLGFRAGVLPGAIAAGCLLLASGGVPRLRALGLPAAGALLAAPMGLLVGAWDPLDLDAHLTGLLPPGPRRAAFAAVWGVHACAYAGAAAGLAAGIRAASRVRR